MDTRTEVEILRDRILELERELRTDPLTGLGNYRAFREHVDFLKSTHDPFSVVLFDMTNLKRANTILGHFGADKLLQLVGEVLRDEDAVYRHGGDEFAIVLPGCRRRSDAQRIRDRVEKVFGELVLEDGAIVRLIGACSEGDELNDADRRLERRKAEWKKDRGQPSR